MSEELNHYDPIAVNRAWAKALRTTKTQHMIGWGNPKYGAACALSLLWHEVLGFEDHLNIGQYHKICDFTNLKDEDIKQIWKKNDAGMPFKTMANHIDTFRPLRIKIRDLFKGR